MSKKIVTSVVLMLCQRIFFKLGCLFSFCFWRVLFFFFVFVCIVCSSFLYFLCFLYCLFYFFCFFCSFWMFDVIDVLVVYFLFDVLRLCCFFLVGCYVFSFFLCCFLWVFFLICFGMCGLCFFSVVFLNNYLFLFLFFFWKDSNF